MLEEKLLPDYFLEGDPRKAYWLLTRGLGVFISVLSFYLFVPQGADYLELGQFSPGNRLLATSIFASSLLTFALIAVYRDLGRTQAQQADIMDEQRELRRMELDRGVRQKHTEVLRHRVEEWLGSAPATSSEWGELTDQSSTLPQVQPTDVEPAAKGIDVVGERDSFRVAPAWLEGEQYFEDLLENHAPELSNLKVQIEELHQEYQKQRQQFVDGVADGPQKETDLYKIEPGPNYPEWVYRQAVLLERGFESREELVEIAWNVIHAESIAREDKVTYPGQGAYASPSGVYQAFSKTGDRDVFSQYGETIEREIVSLLQERIHEIHKEAQYDAAQEAADKLDEMGQKVVQLRFKLAEYQGLPLYPGKCEYLKTNY